MAAILAQFGGNPFATPVGQKIEQATDASLASENWALNMEICDLINETDEGPKDAVKAVRKRLQQNAGKNYTVVMYTLTVLETCVKNCGKRFHLLITQKDFILDLVKLIGPKNDPPAAVQEKVLSLIQSWADAFRTNSEMQGVVQVYQDLKQKGIEFPMTDLETMAPIHTPQRSIPFHQQPHGEVERPPQPVDQHPVAHQVSPVRSSGPLNLSSEQLAKLKSELDVVQGNMKVFGEMLTEMTPGKEHDSDWELLQDLQRTCRAMQSRVVELIDRIANEEVTNELLRINDELNNLFLRYERYEKKKTLVSQSQPVQTQQKQENGSDEKSLIDFGENGTAGSDNIQTQLAGLDLGSTNATSAISQITMVSATNQPRNENQTENDDFDMFAQSRNISCEQTRTSGSVCEDNTNQNQISVSLGSLTSAKATSHEEEDMIQKLHREQDFDEMERWLEDKPAADKGVQPTITSSEFDRFLAERAAKAEQLPVVTTAGDTQATTSTNSSGKRTMDRAGEENSLFAL
ncbi:TOM1-like protein 2 isoform X1 [Tachypleus tridentatus]|uniref:TOM1-like protein 2 isoform X1 n=1 Tax=Tachypleus tridentatus TaxID=6853 RepID=UPI003FD2F4E9